MTKQVKSRQRVADHGEVFTAEREVNAMLDLVKQETERVDSRFLEPACGDGNFLSEILRRKLEAAKKRAMPPRKKRPLPIEFEKQSVIAVSSVYGVDLLLDNVLACRRRLYDIWNAEYEAVCRGEVSEERREAVRFILSRNIVCGNALSLKAADENGSDTDEPIVFSEWSFVTGTKMQRRDFRFDKLLAGEYGASATRKKRADAFDVIIGNPPYQLSDGGGGAGRSAAPVYHFFVQQAKRLNPRYVSMIIPSRWFNGGKGLGGFRQSMLNDGRMAKIVDYADSRDCFKGVDIPGGVCYFLWDNRHQGTCAVTNVAKDGSTDTEERALNEFDTFIRQNRAVGIVKKAQARGETMMSEMVSSRKPFGLESKQTFDANGDIVLRSSAGIGKVLRSRLLSGFDLVDKWKVIVSKVAFEHAGVPDKEGKMRVLSVVQKLAPLSACTESYLVAGAFDSEGEADHLLAYLNTKFARFLIMQMLASMNMSRSSYSFVPVQSWEKAWSDEELYDKYGLSDDEIAFVEHMIRPMPPCAPAASNSVKVCSSMGFVSVLPPIALPSAGPPAGEAIL